MRSPCISDRCENAAINDRSESAADQIEARAMVAYNREAAAFRWIRDHLVNIAEGLVGEKQAGVAKW